MIILNKRAQSTLEYAIIVAVVVGALLAMQIYIKRGVQGRLRSSTDNIGDQYSAGNITAKYVTEETGENKTNETVGYDSVGKGVTVSKIVTAPVVTRQATGEAAEKVTTDLKDEDLFNEQGTLFDTD